MKTSRLESALRVGQLTLPRVRFTFGAYGHEHTEYLSPLEAAREAADIYNLLTGRHTPSSSFYLSKNRGITSITWGEYLIEVALPREGEWEQLFDPTKSLG